MLVSDYFYTNQTQMSITGPGSNELLSWCVATGQTVEMYAIFNESGSTDVTMDADIPMFYKLALLENGTEIARQEVDTTQNPVASRVFSMTARRFASTAPRQYSLNIYYSGSTDDIVVVPYLGLSIGVKIYEEGYSGLIKAIDLNCA